eukprot:8184635-Lingulodinium_polyedra.AAC.1
MPSRAYLLSVRSREAWGTARAAATAASSSARWAVWAPGTGPAHVPPPAPGTCMAHAARAIS